jgi:hypothetical protein
VKQGIPKLPTGTSPKWFFMRAVWFALWGGYFPIRGAGGCKVEWLSAEGGYVITAAPVVTPIVGHRWAAAGINYDKTFSYTGDLIGGEEVWIYPSDPLISTGTTDPDTMATAYAAPGLWRCLRPVAPVVISGTTYYRIPQFPLPDESDITADNNYWLRIAAFDNCP